MQRLPKRKSVKGVFSSITKSYVESIIPTIAPNENEITEILGFLGMSRENIHCAYCGDPCTEWDHFRPLVKNKRPTGYISEIDNFVPSCGKCNFSKGNKDWQVWFKSTARLSPTTRQVDKLNQLFNNLLNYEANTQPVLIDFSEFEKHPIWIEYWESHEKLESLVSEIDKIGLEVKRLIQTDIKFMKPVLPKTIFTFTFSKKEKVQKLWDMLIEAAVNKHVTTYQEVADKIGIVARGVGPYLSPIEEFCEINHLPKLSCLVVSSVTKKPSEGYAVKNDSIELDQAEVYDYDWSKLKIDFKF